MCTYIHVYMRRKMKMKKKGSSNIFVVIMGSHAMLIFLPNRGENVSMCNFKEIENASINMLEIQRVPK